MHDYYGTRLLKMLIYKEFLNLLNGCNMEGNLSCRKNVKNSRFLYIANRFVKVKNVIKSMVFGVMLMSPYEEKQKMSKTYVFCADIILVTGEKCPFIKGFRLCSNALLWGGE